MSRDVGVQSDYDVSSYSDVSSSSKASGQEPGLLESAKLLERELRSIVYDHLLLAALETRRAGESLVRIVAMGLITALLLFTAWLALVSAGVVVLVQNSFVTAGGALLLVFAVHCVCATFLVLAIRKRSKYLMFPATINGLKPATPADSDTERSS